MSGDESQLMEFDGFSDEISMEADASADAATHPSDITHNIMSGRESRSTSGGESSPEGTSPHASPSPPRLEREVPIVTSARRVSTSDRSRDLSQHCIPVVANVKVLRDTPDPQKDLHANGRSKDGNFVVPRSLPVRGRDFELDPDGILAEGGGRRLVPALPSLGVKLGIRDVLVALFGIFGKIVRQIFYLAIFP